MLSAKLQLLFHAFTGGHVEARHHAARDPSARIPDGSSAHAQRCAGAVIAFVIEFFSLHYLATADCPHHWVFSCRVRRAVHVESVAPTGRFDATGHGQRAMQDLLRAAVGQQELSLGSLRDDDSHRHLFDHGSQHTVLLLLGLLGSYPSRAQIRDSQSLEREHDHSYPAG